MSISKSIIDITNSYIETNAFLFEELPIKLDDLIKKEGIDLISYPFKDEISGVLILDGEMGECKLCIT
jgi:hypothetical protein